MALACMAAAYAAALSGLPPALALAPFAAGVVALWATPNDAATAWERMVVALFASVGFKLRDVRGVEYVEAGRNRRRGACCRRCRTGEDRDVARG